MDDLDTPRNEPGAADAIAFELERLGLEWDGEVHFQSTTAQRYRDALEQLARQGSSFPCGCSRRDLVNGVYRGNCRLGLAPGKRARAVRLRVSDEAIRVADAIQGPYDQNLERACGDFVVLRADGIVAYHLATVVDDAMAGVTDVIRGADLLASTPRQMALQHALGVRRPRYAHLPVLRGADGRKLSKQNLAPATHTQAPLPLWRRCLRILGQSMPDLDRAEDLEQLRAAAVRHWRRECVPARARERIQA